MVNTRELTILMADTEFEGRTPKRAVVLTLETIAASDIQKSGDFFVISAATGLESVSPFIREANSMHSLRCVLVRIDVDCAWMSPLLDKANLRTRNTLVHASPDVPTRVLGAWSAGAQHELIADATVAGDRLFVRSCTLDCYEIRFSDIPALADLPQQERPHFTVDPDGSFLHWACGDVHIGVETIRYVLDPEFRTKANVRRMAFDVRFGAAVRAVRLARGLRQSDIPSLSAKQVSRIEAGQGTPRLTTIRKLADAHGLSVDSYLERIASALSDAKSLSTAR